MRLALRSLLREVDVINSTTKGCYIDGCWTINVCKTTSEFKLCCRRINVFSTNFQRRKNVLWQLSCRVTNSSTKGLRCLVLCVFNFITDQWRNQPDNLVPPSKFPIINHYSFLYKLIVFTVNKCENICIAGLNRRAGCANCNKSVHKLSTSCVRTACS